MKTQTVIPGAKRLIESLRNLGYDTNTAIADLIDNSLVAEASVVHVDICAAEGKTPAHIVIADNGYGMDAAELQEAMRFGAQQEYSEDDLGKFGLGLKTASLSQCRLMTILSRPKKGTGGPSKKTIMRWDLEHVYRKDEWEIQVPESSELAEWENKALENSIAKRNGTVVLWQSLEATLSGLAAPNASKRERELAEVIEEVRLHLRIVFHRFIQGTVPGRKKLELYVCNEKLKPWDPFCKQEKTQELDPLKCAVSEYFPEAAEKRGFVYFHPFILPLEDEFSSPEAHKIAGGPKGWNAQQGFYYYRNNRLLHSGGWSNLRMPEEHIKYLRIMVQFPSSLDKSFSLNITKMKAHIPPEIRQVVKEKVTAWAVYAGKEYRRGGRGSGQTEGKADTSPDKNPAPSQSLKMGGVVFALSNTTSRNLSVINDRDSKDLKVAIPYGHDNAMLFDKTTGLKGNLKRFSLGVLSLLEMVHEGKLKPKDIPVNALKRNLRKLL